MKKRILLSFFLIIIFLILFLFWWQRSLQAVNSQEKKAKIFVVQKGANVNQIARRLEEESLIRSKVAFFLLIKKEGAEKNIQAGTFRLSPAMRAEEVLKELSHGTLDIWVTIVEGWRNEEIAALLDEELGSSPADFLEVAVEGYMFPDTYAFPKEASVEKVVKMMRDNFAQKFNQELRQVAAKNNLPERDVVILASIVEREALYSDDRPVVAGILLNRLKIGMALQVDAAVQYALGYQVGQKTWWKKDLTKADLTVDSPYNTYANVGLPPGPISNPGLASIRAVVYPQETNHLYYLSDSEGRMHYAETLEGHNENIRKYLN